MDAVRRLIVGIGNPDRGDDGVGHEVVRLLEGRGEPDDVVLVRESGEAAALMECFGASDAVWLIDAAASGSPPGTIRRFDAGAGPLPAKLSEVSSHGFGLGQAIELARALGTLPGRCVVYAVEGERFDVGAPLSPTVALAARAVVGRLLREVAAPAGERGDRIVHEASLMAGLIRQIEAVADREGAVSVTRLKVWCGALSHMSREHFNEHFEQASTGTRAEGAVLDITLSNDHTDPRAQEVILESVDIET